MGRLTPYFSSVAQWCNGASSSQLVFQQFRVWRCFLTFVNVWEQGIEPRFTGSKPGVLPLDDSQIVRVRGVEPRPHESKS